MSAVLQLGDRAPQQWSQPGDHTSAKQIPLLGLPAVKLLRLHKRTPTAWLHLEHNLHSVKISTCLPETQEQSSQERKCFMEEGGGAPRTVTGGMAGRSETGVTRERTGLA